MAGMITSQAKAVAANLKFENPELTPTVIIGIAELILQFLGAMWKSNSCGIPGSTNASDYVGDHFNPDGDVFEESLMGTTRGQTRRAIRMRHREGAGPALRLLSQEDIDNLSKTTLKQVMSTPSATASCLAEVDN